MYLYNVSIIVENDIRDAIKAHLHDEFLGEQRPNGAFALLELLDSPHEGTTFCLQLRCRDQADIVAFQTSSLATLQAWLNQAYRGKVVFFDSMMKYLND